MIFTLFKEVQDIRTLRIFRLSQFNLGKNQLRLGIKGVGGVVSHQEKIIIYISQVIITTIFKDVKEFEYFLQCRIFSF